MKKIFLIAALIAFAYDSNAQSAGPNELRCTEEAFTLRANFSSGWHFSAASIGNQQFSGTKPANLAYLSSKLDLICPDRPLLPNVNRPVNTSMIFEGYTTTAPHPTYTSPFDFKIPEPMIYTYPIYRKFADQQWRDSIKFSSYTK